MTRHPLSTRLPWAAALAFSLASPGISFAQTGGSGGTGGTGGSMAAGNISAQILTIGGVSQDDNRVIWINRAACLNDAEIVFRLDQFPMDKQLDVYVGEACNTMLSRDGEGTDCQLILRGEDLPGTDDQRVTLRAAEMVNTALATDDCGEQRSMPDLWFLAVSTPGGTEELGADNYGRETLNVDTDPPAAPTSIRGGRGENEIPVTWSVGNETVDSFEIYADPGDGTGVSDASTAPPPASDDDGGTEPQAEPGATNAMCGTGALRAGAAADSIASLLVASEGSPTATSTMLSASDVGGKVAAVGVIALDEAGNRSPLSEIQCVYVVPTTGFKDLYEQENGEIPQGCPCAAAGPAQVEGALPIALALGLIAYRRRRRS